MSDEITYTLTRGEFRKRLADAIGLFIEYRDQHEKDEETAALLAVAEVLEGQDALVECARLGREAGIADIRRILGV